MELCYRWLGVAGLEFTADGYTLLIDPFLTRPGKLALISGKRVRSDRRLVAQHIHRADAVLVTHAHYDHLLDVPEVLHHTGADVYGTPNTCAVLQIHAIPAEKINCIHPGDHLSLGPFEVEVFPAHHTPIPFGRFFNGPLPKSMMLRPHMPLRLMDYRMDIALSFRIRVGNLVLLVGNHPVPADVLFISPYRNSKTLEEAARVIQPRRVVLIHWDDFTRPLSRPLLPMPVTPFQGPRRGRRMVGRLDLEKVLKDCKIKIPEIQVTVPRVLQQDCLGDPDRNQ